MCGIGLTLVPESNQALETGLKRKLIESIAPRGPDYQGESSVTLDLDGWNKKNEPLGEDADASFVPITSEWASRWVLTLHASVLHMRGKELTAQPFQYEAKGRNYAFQFCWNGECYSHDQMKNHDAFDMAKEEEDISDTALVMSLLQDALECSTNGLDERSDCNRAAMDQHCQVAQVLSHVHGEYAFILHCSPDSMQKDKGCVYFGRDVFGRRSLLITKGVLGEHRSCEALDSLILSSVGLDSIESDNDSEELEEIPAGKVFRLDLNTGQLSFIPIPNNDVRTNINETLSKNTFAEEPDVPSRLLKAAEKLHYYLNQAVRRRVINAPVPKGDDDQAGVAVLFSGGVDSVVLAALCHNHVPEDHTIDLINVAFATTKSNSVGKEGQYSLSPDRQAALLSFQEMRIRWPNRKWRFVAVNVDYREVLEMEKTICNLIRPLDSTMDFNIGTAFWFASRGRGEIIDNLEESVIDNSQHLRFAGNAQKEEHKCNAISTDAIECSTKDCKRKISHGCRFRSCKVCCGNYQRPINQYLGGRANLCPVHNSIQKGKKGAKKKKKKVTQKITTKSVQNAPVVYTSNARIIIIGIGADEQMAGYGRHRSVFNNGGYAALRQELQMEKERIWTRNLGRDDRCISYHGKEARSPFLDNNVVSFLNSLDVTELCDMTKPQGLGDKMVLRLVAKNIGVVQCSGLVKRAIQFGSRIAKCSDVDRFGSSRKASGQTKHGKSLLACQE